MGKAKAAHANQQHIAALSPKRRGEFLTAIGHQLESRRPEIVAIAVRESGLPEKRINSELTRTIFQLMHFYFDMFIWKFSNNHTRENLGPFLFAKL